MKRRAVARTEADIRERALLHRAMALVSEPCPYCDGARLALDWCVIHRRQRLITWHARGCAAIGDPFLRRECQYYLADLLTWYGLPVAHYNADLLLCAHHRDNAR